MTAPAFFSFRWFCCAGAASFHFLPSPPPDKVRHNEGVEFRSCPFLAHSDALCPEAGTGSGTGSGPKYSPRLRKTHLPSVNKRARGLSSP